MLKYGWPDSTPPKNPQLAYEIKMKGFGNVDCVVADVGPNYEIKQFVSVELQAIDITGSVFPAYEAITNSEMLKKSPSYGLNYANVYKRFVTQLIVKGYYHHHWKTKIVAVMQDLVYQNIAERYEYSEADPKKANIIFLIYKYAKDKEDPTRHNLVFDKVIRTHHSNLQSAILYSEPPLRTDFCKRIIKRLGDG